MLANFDAPSREECTGLRTEANTPLQALTLLNDPTFVEAARVLATESLRETSGGEERIRWLFVRALAREPSPQEMAIMLQVQVSQRAHFAADEAGAKRFLSIGLTPLPETDDVVDLASWASVARAILNLHETITRY
jgi:hypothetical protein